jgi:hypothetical protein
MNRQVISMASRSQKTPRNAAEKDRELEKLLSSAFRILNAQKQAVRINTSGTKRNRKVQ